MPKKQKQTSKRTGIELAKLSEEERRAVLALETLAVWWPPSLTLMVTSASAKIYVIKTPKPGEPGYDDLDKAEIVAVLRIPTDAMA